MRLSGGRFRVRRLTIGLAWALAAVSAANVSAQPNQSKANPKKNEIPPELPVSYSKTGYVDNAIVGTQLKIRYDAGFGIDRPDRAEFFYGKCGCFRPGLDPSAPGPVPDAPSPANRVVETRIDYLDLRLGVEYAFDRRFSWFAEVPFRMLRPEVNAKVSGLADIQTGVRFAAVASPRRYLTLQLRGYVPVGEAFRGLGTGHASLEPALLYFERVDHLTLEMELAYWHPTSGSSAAGVFVPGPSPRDRAGLPAASDRFFGDVVRYGLGLSYASDSQWGLTPVVELVGWSVRGGFETVSNNGVPRPPRIAETARGSSILNLKAGLRVGPVYFGYGRALTRDVWYKHIFRIEYRVSY